MNKILKLFSILSLVAMMFAACTPDEYELQAPLDKSAVKFSVTRSEQNPNVFYLNSETSGAQPYWVTPVGTSIKMKDTINIPFPATAAEILYTVESPGGLVTADPYIFDITTIDEEYVSDPMWSNLTGGIGNSKTWVLDLDADGVSKYFAGPFYFGGPGWEWAPAFSDIPWAGVSAGDYGTMTFDLIGNANFTCDNKMFPELSGTGTFMLFPGKSELITYGAEVIHDHAQGDGIANWNAKMTIKTLTADQMQLICYKDPNNWLTYNYITKDYYDSH
ncbi:hypothetical protein QUH73_05850 [Labilibaculum sp. K2S]|uniref:hypothetical protein n=1 Tax=Labilibaculum sp. K2S TaxID=3056386 RepID=UPI0025A32AE7|nr:hypothetical protein [Labilibaculum sp. K2S]MDM8159335.1 hypothetical protein [Labilibaculum sp. K2S]